MWSGWPFCFYFGFVFITKGSHTQWGLSAIRQRCEAEPCTRAVPWAIVGGSCSSAHRRFHSLESDAFALPVQLRISDCNSRCNIVSEWKGWAVTIMYRILERTTSAAGLGGRDGAVKLCCIWTVTALLKGLQPFPELCLPVAGTDGSKAPSCPFLTCFV